MQQPQEKCEKLGSVPQHELRNIIEPRHHHTNTQVCNNHTTLKPHKHTQPNGSNQTALHYPVECNLPLGIVEPQKDLWSIAKHPRKSVKSETHLKDLMGVCTSALKGRE